MTLTPSLSSQSAPIIERAPLPLVEVQGRAHVITYVNPAFCRLLGRASGELVGTTFADIVPGGYKCVPILDSVYETGEGRTHALADESDVNPACWLYAMWPALDAAGVPVGVVIQMTKDPLFRQNVAAVNEALLVAGLGQHELRERAEKLNVQLQAEIAEREQAQAAVQEAKAQLANHARELERTVAERTAKLRETVADLEAFSYSVAHDLRAPLRSLQGYSTSSLEEYAEKLDETGKMYLERMARSAVRMDKLIQDVLSYTRLLGADPKLESIDLDRLVRDLIETYPDWYPPKVNLQIEGKLPSVRGHEALVAQCVSNIVNNALKFVSPGTQPRVKIWAESVNNYTRIWFQDNGVGIAKEDQARIF